MFFFNKDLAALGQYIESLIRRDSRVSDNFNEAARLSGVSPAELFSLRKGCNLLFHYKMILQEYPTPEIFAVWISLMSGVLPECVA